MYMKYFIQAWIVGNLRLRQRKQSFKLIKNFGSERKHQQYKFIIISWNYLISFSCEIFSFYLEIVMELKGMREMLSFFSGTWSEMIRWWKECKYLKIYPNILWKPKISLMLWQAMCKNLIPVSLFLMTCFSVVYDTKQMEEDEKLISIIEIDNCCRVIHFFAV